FRLRRTCSRWWSRSINLGLGLDFDILLCSLHLQRLECLALARSVRHVEAQINPQERIQKNDQNLDGKGDTIERAFTEIARHRLREGYRIHPEYATFVSHFQAQQQR